MSAIEAFFKLAIAPLLERVGLLEAGSSAANAALFQATSTTTVSIPTTFPATRTFATQAGKAFVNGQFIQITDQANPARYMQGQVTYSGSTLIMTVAAASGSGSGSAWDIGVSGPGAVGAMSKGGDTMTGPLILSGDPTTALQAATKAYVDGIVAVQDAMVFKGVIDASASPNYPDANRGWTYRISVAGKIGGASGVNVEAGDVLICLTDNTASGNQAGVGANWSIVQANLDGVLNKAGDTMTGDLGEAPEVDVASAATCDIGAANTNRVRITGTTPITSFGTIANRRKRVRFAGALILTHNATSLILPGGANILTAAGDVAIFESNATGAWRMVSFTRAASQYEGGFGPAGLIGAGATVDLGLQTSHLVTLGGSQVTIASFGASASLDQPIYMVRFNTPHTLVHNATSMILPGGANIVFTSDDVGVFQYLGSGNWRMIGFMRANGWLSGAGPVGQIAFPASQNPSSDPNTLDDYEEGTWTPTLTTDGTQPTGVIIHGSQSCGYIKIGRMVMIWGRIQLASKGTGGTGNVNFTGLPFGVAGIAAGVAARYTGVTLASGVLGFALSSTTMLMERTGAGTYAAIPWSDIADNLNVAFSAVYSAGN